MKNHNVEMYHGIVLNYILQMSPTAAKCSRLFSSSEDRRLHTIKKGQ